MGAHHRIHVLGAAGCGTSTLGRALATALSSQVFDSDDFYWQPTDPPFTQKRPAAERLALMEAMFLPRRSWVLSGSFMGWCDPIVPRLTHVVFISMPPAIRLARLRARERRRYGKAILPGGPQHRQYCSFLDWAMSYDDPGAGFIGRTRANHEAWLAEMRCPVIRVDGSRPVNELVEQVSGSLDPVLQNA